MQAHCTAAPTQHVTIVMYSGIGCLNRRFSSSRRACFSASVIPLMASKNLGSLATCAPFFKSSTCSSRCCARAKSRTSRRSCSGVRCARGFSMLPPRIPNQKIHALLARPYIQSLNVPIQVDMRQTIFG